MSRDGQAVPVDTTWSFQSADTHGWALSPDGTQLAIGIRAGGNDDIWVKQPDRGPASRLTFSDSADSYGAREHYRNRRWGLSTRDQ